MSFRIVVDSCCDLPEKYRKDPTFKIVPLILQIGNEVIVDDDAFDQASYLEKISASEECPKTACPSPDLFMEAYDCDADDIYVVTLSSKLSGSYNSALLARDIYHEEKGDKNIHIFDSLTAASGEVQVALRAFEYASKGLPFDEVVEKVETFRDSMVTYFVLDSLENLRRNGRLSGMKAVVASTLNIKPVCYGLNGEIIQKSQGIGMKKALVKMADLLAAEIQNAEDRVLMITHVNCYERACVVRDLILGRLPFKDSLILEAAGVSTTYGDNGGIIVTC